MQAKYPSFMSRHIDWPDDALESTPILGKHDLEMVELMSRPNDKAQDQRRRKSAWHTILLSGCIAKASLLTAEVVNRGKYILSDSFKHGGLNAPVSNFCSELSFAVPGCSKPDKAALNFAGCDSAACSNVHVDIPDT